jgi:hypothetical protein
MLVLQGDEDCLTFVVSISSSALNEVSHTTDVSKTPLDDLGAGGTASEIGIGHTIVATKDQTPNEQTLTRVYL